MSLFWFIVFVNNQDKDLNDMYIISATGINRAE